MKQESPQPPLQDSENENRSESSCVSRSLSDGSIVPPPDGGWGWVVVFASLMLHIIADGVTYTFGIFYVEFLNHFGGGNGETAWIASILVGVTYCSGPITSSLTNRFGCRAVTIAGSVLAALGLAISTIAPNILTLYFSIGLITGLGFGLMFLPAIVSVTSYFEKRRAFATGIAVCGSGLGTFIMAPLTEWLIEMYTWKGAMLIVAALVFNCSICGALFRPVEYTYESEGDKKKNWKCSYQLEENTPAKNMLVTKDDLTPPTIVITDTQTPPSFVSVFKKKQQICNESEVMAGEYRMAISTPTLSEVGLKAPQEGELRPFGSHGSLHKDTKNPNHHLHPPTIQRKDIFYSGSLYILPQFSENPRLYTASVIKRQDNNDESVKLCGCVSVSQQCWQSLREMLNLEILKDWLFIIFTISNFLTSLGFNVPYVYITDRAVKMNLTPSEASHFLSAMGIANTVGRVLLGYLSDKPWVNRLYIYNIALIICGVATGLSSVCTDYVSLMIYSCIFGMTAGAYVSLTSVILVDLLGMDKLTNAFGLLLMFVGIASAVGSPVAGLLYDEFKSYDPGFWLAGAMICFSGIILFFVPCIQRLNYRRETEPRLEERSLLKNSPQHTIVISKTDKYQNIVNGNKYQKVVSNGSAIYPIQNGNV